MAHDLLREGVTADGAAAAAAGGAEHCPRCFDAHVLATALGREVRCPGCGATWWDPPERGRRVDVESDLRAVARWRPHLEGRAWRPSESGVRGGAMVDGRPDDVDAHHRDRTGFGAACRAMTTLDALERAGYALEADVLWFAYVVSGEALAASCGGVEALVATRFTPGRRLQHWKGHKSRRVRQVQMRSRGDGLLAWSREAYAAAARGELASRDVRPGEVLRQLSRDAEALRARVAARLERVARVANNGR